MTVLALNSLAAAIKYGVDEELERNKLYGEMLSLAAVAEEDGEENQIDTTEIGSAASLVSALQPVTIDKDLYKEYNTFFFRGKRTRFAALLKSVGEVSVALNYFFTFMRSLMKDGRRISRLESDPAALRTYIQTEAARFYEYTTVHEQRNSPLADSVSNMLMSIMAGSKFYLRSSQVYNSGYDIVVREGIRDTNLVGNTIGAENFMSSFTHDYGYDADRLEAFSCETCLLVQRAAEKIIAEMFGGAATATASSPVEATLPLNYDFPGLQRIFESTLGISLPVDFFHRIDYKSVRGSDAQNFVRLVFVLAPDRRLSDAIKSDLGRASATTDANPLDLLPTILHRQTQSETKESRVLNRSFGGTLAFTLSEDISKFISQSESPNPNNIKSWYVIWASQFLRRTGKTSQAKSAVRVGRIRLNQIPRFSLPISQLESVTKIRNTVGMTVESTRANEDDIYFSTDGTLSSLPPVEERASFTHLTEFEAIGRELAELAVKYGAPLSVFRGHKVDAALLGISTEDFERGKELNDKLDAYQGSLLSYDWDYGLKFYAGAGGLVTAVKEAGATKPHDLAVASLLGYDMSRDGEEPDVRSFADAVHLAISDDPSDIDGTPADIYGDRGAPDKFLNTGVFDSIFRLWYYHSRVEQPNGELLPNAQEVVHRAMAALGYDKLDAETPNEQGTLYRQFIADEQGTLHPASSPEVEFANIKNMVRTAIQGCCSGSPGSVVYRQALEESGGGEDLIAAIEEHPLYFVPSVSPVHHMSRLYATLGGQILKQIMDIVRTLPKETINVTETRKDVKFNVNSGGEVRTANWSAHRPASGVVYDTLKPLSTLLGKYAVEYDAWKARADDAVSSIRRDEGVDVDDLHFAGNNGKFAVFPHQLDTQRYLRKPKPPEFAVLDIRPGGGKTSIGIVDMAAIVDDLQQIGKRVRPLVICPDGLIRNWCDDIASFAGSNWNVIPVNSAILKRFGYDKLVQMIRSAPINTIVVVGMQFLCNNRMPIVFGSTAVDSGFNLELIKSIGFNYIIIDESHKLKKLTSLRHRMVKQLTTAGFVDYLRIATGTLISDRVTDIEGQTALYSPVIFRSKELAAAISSNRDEDDGQVTINGEVVSLWKVDTPQKARDRLGKYAAVVTKAKKEWAFMLPSPVEAFHKVQISSSEEEDRDRQLSELHRELYDLVVAQSIEELQDLIKKAKGKRSSLGDDDDDDDERDDDETETEGEEEGGNMEFSELDELSVLPDNLVKAYLQRIERLIIAPEQDPAFETVFGAAGVKQFKSRKARYIAGLVDKHFTVPEWSKGSHYNEYDQVKVDGELYLAKKLDLSSPMRQKLDLESVGRHPAEAPEYWRKEPEGKIIIFCRYTNSVNAVYDALGSYQKDAVKFTGEEQDKWANLDAFKYDPKVKILVANEMGMSEGHNLQIASRLIRVESPWGPGELDQSASRIFRPDPAGASEGNIYREVVFLDWVLADNTMEVPKMCRMIAKIFDAARFDEAYNPNFDKVLQHHLPEVSLSLDTLNSRSGLDDYFEYVEAYAELNGVRNNEFHEMRATMSAQMIPVPEHPPVKGSELMAQTPFVAAQKIPDPEGVKPEPLSIWLRHPDNAEMRADPQQLVGRPVLTDQGKGMIVSVRARTVPQLDAEGNPMKDANGKVIRVVDPVSPITSLEVRMKDSSEVVRFNQLGIVYTPTKISQRKINSDYAVDLVYKKSDIRKREREERRVAELIEEAERLEREEEEAKLKSAKRMRLRAKEKKESKEDAGQRRKNLKEGKPINTGIQRKTKPKVQTGVKRTDTPNTGTTEEAARAPLELHPAYYHGYLTLETDNLDFEKDLKKFKFKRFNEYVYVELTRRNQANAVMDYIEEHFHLSDATADRLSEVFTAFEKGKRGLYNLELAPAHTLPHFFTVRRVMVKDRKEARLYPFFKDDLLVIACDLATCPVMKRHIGKAIPGAATSWKLSPGSLMSFVKNKAELKSLVRQIERSGIEVQEPKELQAEITRINFRAARTKK